MVLPSKLDSARRTRKAQSKLFFALHHVYIVFRCECKSSLCMALQVWHACHFFFRYKGVLQVSCAEYSANNSKIYTFDVPTTFGGNVVDVAPTQALWLYLAAVKQRPEPNTIFIDKSIESLSELDDVSRLLPTNVDSQVDMMRCRHALDLRQYPAATFYEYAALSFPGSGSKWFFQVSDKDGGAHILRMCICND